MSRIKIISTNTIRKGVVFHYTPFIFHVLFPEIINQVYKYDEVIRERTVFQTIGNFRNVYTEIMGNNIIELSTEDFNNLNVDTLECEFYEEYQTEENFNIFRNFIFDRYSIRFTEYDNNYPEILLIKRFDRVELVDDDLKQLIPANNTKVNIDKDTGKPFIHFFGDTLYGNETITTPWFLTNGKERREMDKIDDVDNYLKSKFGNKFGSVYLELLPFEEQVRYFNNARVIICAHGGGMANNFFCKEGTKIIEIKCHHKEFLPFDKISEILKLQHVKCQDRYDKIIESIDIHT